MASSLLLRRATSSPFLTKLISPVRVASTSRPFGTNAQVADYDDGEDRRPVSQPRYYPSSFFEDAFDPFSRTGNLIQDLKLMDQFMSPLMAAARGMGAVSRRGWNVKEGKDALFVRMDMPGLGKEDVNVSVEQNTLIIKGHGGKESEDDESGRKYTSRIDLPAAQQYKLDEIKAEMKNGVLKVVVPKVKEDEKKSVFQVNIN